jgi:hypothetical protein
MFSRRATVTSVLVIGSAAAVLFGAAVADSLFETGPLPEPETGIGVSTACLPRSDPEHFFPAGAFWSSEFPDPDRADAAERSWYSGYLRLMDEPSLSCGVVDREVYRFLYLRSFHGAVSVRLERTDDGLAVHAVEMNDDGRFYPEYTPPTVRRRLHTTLNHSHWQTVASAARAANFWNTRTMGGTRGNDGSMWIVEGRDGSRYNLVVRWSPKDKLHTFGMHLIDLSSLSIPERERQ